jgi:hypothetical protein
MARTKIGIPCRMSTGPHSRLEMARRAARKRTGEEDLTATTHQSPMNPVVGTMTRRIPRKSVEAITAAARRRHRASVVGRPTTTARRIPRKPIASTHSTIIRQNPPSSRSHRSPRDNALVTRTPLAAVATTEKKTVGTVIDDPLTIPDLHSILANILLQLV